MSITRRGFLTSTATASAVLAAGASAGHAFTLEDAGAGPVDQYHAARAAACTGPVSYHRRVLADVRARLDGGDIPDQDKRKIVAEATCPLCGCRIAGAQQLEPR